MRPGQTSRRSPSGLAIVEEGSLRIAPILSLPRLLADLGTDPGPLLVAQGIDAALFEDPENTIPFADMGQLLNACVLQTGCPHFGLLIGEHVGIESLGVVGRLASVAPNLGGALRSLILYLHLHDRGAIPSLWVCADKAILAYTVYQPDVTGVDQIYDGALAITHNILRTLAGPGWKAAEIRFSRARPGDPEPYRRMFRTRLIFGAAYSAIVFPAACLERPLGGANPQTQQRIMAEIAALEAHGAGDLVAQLRRVLRRILIAGPGPGSTSLQQIASLFAVHRRTLNRRLKARGTSFRELIDASRYDIARQLLRDTRMPIVEIATALEYADAAAFSRAFQRWSGSPPSAWRKAQACARLDTASSAAA